MSNNSSSDGDVLLSSGNNGEIVESNDNSSDCRPCDPLKILKFVECLSATTSSIEMQILVNKYLQELTNSPYVFLVPLLPSSEEGLIQVIGDRTLDKEIRFSVVGKENNTLIFEIQNTKITSSNTVQQNSLYVCIAGDGEKQATFSYYLSETFRHVTYNIFLSFANELKQQNFYF